MKSKERQKNTTIDQFELTARENNSLSMVFDLKYQRGLFSHLFDYFTTLYRPTSVVVTDKTLILEIVFLSPWFLNFNWRINCLWLPLIATQLPNCKQCVWYHCVYVGYSGCFGSVEPLRATSLKYIFSMISIYSIARTHGKCRDKQKTLILHWAAE